MNETYLMALVMVGSIVLIIFLFAMRAKQKAVRRKAALHHVFRQLTIDNSIVTCLIDEEPAFLIGIDESKMTLVFVRHSDDTVIKEIIALTAVTDCAVMRSGTRIVSANKGRVRATEEHIDEIYLSLKLMDHNTINLPFYREREDGLYEKIRLSQLAEKWCTYVKKALLVAASE